MTETSINVSIDTYITSSNPNNNYTALDYWYVRSTSQYAILSFDLSAIPATNSITSAVLSAYFYNQSGDGSTNIDVYRLKQSWVSNKVTFNSRSTGVTWDTAGALGEGDYDSTSLGQADCVDTNYGWINWSLSASEIKKLIDGTYANYGFILRGSSLKYAYFRSLDYASNYAKLTITHTESGQTLQKFRGYVLG